MDLHLLIRRVAVGVAVVGCLGLVAAALGWRLTGGDWAVIRTPSMGTAAPVGTLILTRPVALPALRVGDVVSYRPANRPDVIVTHRVRTAPTDGAVVVQGDLNGSPDPLPVRQHDLIGRVTVAVPALGWLVRALPTLLLGEVVLLAATGLYLGPRWRSTVRILGTCLLVAGCLLVLRPLVQPVLIGVGVRPGGPEASVVSAGLLPTRITGADGHAIVLRTGEAGVVPVASTAPGGPVRVDGSPYLRGWWLVGMIAVSLLPLLWSLLVGLAPVPPADEVEDGPEDEPGPPA
ncbi:signal peptidase I [Friedmanniella endophytica]|uniref:Signal peptidase I n=1 Tax=Microlunatus kandeliicorticis TaxID=1759536 RepID=A0A7W3IUS6_9ACTN|nr:S26 family signal peptidase [Microlunatus kandeliicorticis]MBA8795579.1 signal peptidase I [Microlunatus kandeliicorticis]